MESKKYKFYLQIMISRDKNSKGFTYTFLELADSINTDIETTKQ